MTLTAREESDLSDLAATGYLTLDDKRWGAWVAGTAHHPACSERVPVANCLTCSQFSQPKQTRVYASTT